MKKLISAILSFALCISPVSGVSNVIAADCTGSGIIFQKSAAVTDEVYESFETGGEDTADTATVTATTTTTTTTTTETIVVDYFTQFEYDQSPMRIGETRKVFYYYGPEMISGGMQEVTPWNGCVECDFDPEWDYFTITAVKPGNEHISVYQEGAFLLGGFDITVLDSYYYSGNDTTTTTTTEDISITMPTTTGMGNEDPTVAEYDHSPMRIGETRPVYFYNGSISVLKRFEVRGLEVMNCKSECVICTYNEGDEVLFLTAVSPGKFSFGLKMEDTGFYGGVALEVLDEQYVPDSEKVELTSDMRKAARQIDFNNNGRPDVEDACILLDYYMSDREVPYELSEEIAKYGDIDGDGAVKPVDSSYLFKFLADTRFPGDVNEDGRVTATDASLVLKYAADYSDTECRDKVLNGRCNTYGDMNGDGKITAADASLILVNYADRSADAEEV